MKNDDEQLWKEFTKDVTKLNFSDKIIHDNKLIVKMEPRDPDIIVLNSELPIEIERDFKVEYTKPNPIKQHNGGKLNIDAKIDLHGFTIQQAFETITEYLSECYYSGRRNVLIVTGHGEGDTSIKREFIFWCCRPPLKSIVSVCEPANREDGNHGAFLVKLKKL